VGDLYVVPAFSPSHEVSVRCRTVTVMSKRVEFRWPEAFLERVDAAAEFESRASFVRRAVEAAVEREEASVRIVETMRSREKPNTVAGVSDSIRRGVDALRELPPEPSPMADFFKPAESVSINTPTPKNSDITPVYRRAQSRRDVKPFQRGGS